MWMFLISLISASPVPHCEHRVRKVAVTLGLKVFRCTLAHCRRQHDRRKACLPRTVRTQEGCRAVVSRGVYFALRFSYTSTRARHHHQHHRIDPPPSVRSQDSYSCSQSENLTTSQIYLQLTQVHHHHHSYKAYK